MSCTARNKPMMMLVLSRQGWNEEMVMEIAWTTTTTAATNTASKSRRWWLEWRKNDGQLLTREEADGAGDPRPRENERVDGDSREKKVKECRWWWAGRGDEDDDEHEWKSSGMKIILKMYCGRGVDADGEVRVEVSWRWVGALQRNGGEREGST